MRLPSFIHETRALAKQQPVWALAFFATALLPIMLIYARVGVEISSAIIGLSFLWHSWRSKQWRWLHTPFSRACLATWAWIFLIVTPLALEPKAGFIVAAMWFRLPLLFSALRYWVLARPEARMTLGIFLAGLLALVAVDCCVQSFTGMSLSGHPTMAFNRLSGPFLSPKVGIYMSMLAVPTIAFCFATGLKVPCKRILWFSLGLLFLILAAIVLSGERTAFVGMVMACSIAIGLLMVGDKRLRIAGCLAGAGATALIGLLYMTNPTVQTRAGQLIDVVMHYPESPYGMLAGVGVDIGKQHWLHGVGLQGFNALAPVLTFEDIQFHGLHPHNYYSEWFAEAGIPGLLLFIMILVCLTRECMRHLRGRRGLERLAAAVAFGALAQHFFPLMPSQSFFTNWGAMLQWYSLGLAFAAMPRNDAQA